MVGFFAAAAAVVVRFAGIRFFPPDQICCSQFVVVEALVSRIEEVDAALKHLEGVDVEYRKVPAASTAIRTYPPLRTCELIPTNNRLSLMHHKSKKRLDRQKNYFFLPLAAAHQINPLELKFSRLV